VLLELSSAQDEAAATASLEGLLEAAIEAGQASDAAVSASLAQFRSLWALREDISESQGAEGPTIKHDIALPIARIPAFIHATGAALARHWPELRLVVFGHLGDGNLHYNLSPPATGMGRPEFSALEGPVNRLVHDAVQAAGGSISAEHGLGVLRRDEAARYKTAVERRLMQAVKTALDPLNLMNPGKLLGPLGRD
jgi:FAD/FMN-containing dehydrogenase